MPLIPFPDVPDVPGVPAIFRSLTVPTVTQLAVAALGGLTDLLFGTPQWGIYDADGNQALEPDSFISLRFKNDARVTNAPLEAGAFASYNKVQTPYDASVRMALGGDEQSRSAFLAQADAMVKSTDLFTIVTPEAVYQNVNLTFVSYSRQQKNGATMLLVDLGFEEIRQTAIAQYSQVQSASGASPVNDGQVQAFPIADAKNLQTGLISPDEIL